MHKISATLLAVVFVVACNKKASEDSSVSSSETAAESVGDVMASIDESGGSSGTLAMLQGEARMFARLAPELNKDSSIMAYILPKAYASSCLLGSTFSSCSNNVITRTFSSCSVGLATFNGTVTLTWVDAAVNNTCLMNSSGHSITRNPNFTITGPFGGQYSVSKTGTNGQTITYSNATTFAFSNDGIRRTITHGGSTLADFTTQTTSDITITGASRSSRALNGGNLRVTNNLTNVTCDFVPSSVSWTGSTCNCPQSGSWSANCSDGKSGTITLTGCGTGTYTLNGSSSSVTFDRCG